MAKPRPELVEDFADKFSQLGTIEVKPFFGGWQFRCGGRQFAAYIKDILYFRVDDGLRAALQAQGAKPFCYNKLGKTVTVNGYHSAPESALDDSDELLAWASRALSVA